MDILPASTEPGEALRRYADAGNVHEMERLLAEDVDPNAADADGFTPLHYAMNRYPQLPHKDHLAVVRTLLAAGANPNAAAHNGQTPLLDAVGAGLREVVVALLEHGADPHVRLEGGAGAWHVLADAMAELQPPEPLEPPADAGGSASPEALRQALETLAPEPYDEYLAIADILAERDVSLATALEESQHTPLFLAAAYGLEELTDLMLEAGADPGARDAWGLTPLHYAARAGYLETLLLLLNAGADVDAQDDYGFTALHAAAAAGELEVVRTLLSRGARRDLRLTRTYERYSAGDTPLDVARKARQRAVADLLKTVR